MKRPIALRLERLEDRANPSTLTVSFVPDGTQVGALTSELYSDNAGIAPAVWQQQLLGELQTAVSAATLNTVTLTLIPDDGASMNTPAPEDGAIRIAAVDQLFASNGTAVAPPAGTDFMVAGGATATFGTGLGLIGPNGQPLTPAPTPPGQQTSGSMLPLILPVQKAYGNLYPNPPVSMPMPAPAPTPAPNPTGSTTPSYSEPSTTTPVLTPTSSPDATTPTTPATTSTSDALSGLPGLP